METGILDTITAIKTSITEGKESLVKRGIEAQIKELEEQTSAPNLWDDAKKANALFAKLKLLKAQWEPIIELEQTANDLLTLTQESSEQELQLLESDVQKLQTNWHEAERALYLGGEFDTGNCYLSISSGAGGTEAQDWTAMLLRMYLRYCEDQGLKTSITEETAGTEAGIKTVTVYVQGSMAYGNLKTERGTHRLVRLSPFNAKNLRQTSFALVEVLPEVEQTDEVDIDPNDLRVDTYRSGGAGGQHANKTDSAVRITHLPTGIAIACQSERSQQQNRATAMSMLYAKLLELKRAEDAANNSELKGASASADFGQQIRSYVLHPYQMVKDLRTNTETSDTTGVLDGDIQQFIDAELKRSASQ